MDKEYQYRPETQVTNGGYPGEPVGVIPAVTQWETTSAPTGFATYTYYYTDTNTADNAPLEQKNGNSSQVQINATDEWSVIINDDNELSVTVHTVINSIRRTNIVGNPNYIGTWGRDIQIRRSQNGVNLFAINNNPINREGSLISSPIDLGTETFVIKPGVGNRHSSFYVLNHTNGLGWEPQYWDEMNAGISFQNILPNNYRPMAVWNGYNWASCNRSGGWMAVWTGSGWPECRTQEGGIDSDDPPSYWDGSSWKNQHKVGQN